MEKKKIWQVVAGVIAVLICGIFYLCTNKQPGDSTVVTEKYADETETISSQSSSAKVYVDIGGEVKNPGVYIFDEEPRLVDVIQKAGGLTKKADSSSINQAQIVPDGTQITIAGKNKSKKTKTAADESSSGNSANSVSGGNTANDISTSSTQKININTASKEELTTLSGIGESRAKQIVAYREENGNFGKIEDIMNVSGIKEGIFNKIKDDITV
jgi:competence protein ComEA